MTVNRYILALIFFVFAVPEFSYAEPNHAKQKNAAEESTKQQVTGIGGLFFRSSNPESLSEWYETHLGVNRTPTSYDDAPWQQEQGPTIFAPFKKDTEYFGDPTHSWMINFRVNDLDAMVKQLENAGIEVKVDAQSYPNGRFARLSDPEGNPIQLWEPITSN